MSNAPRDLTDDERSLLNHVCRWGSDGYPVRKVKSRWIVDDWRTVKGFPCVFKTKREAVARFEMFYEILLECDSYAAYKRACGSMGTPEEFYALRRGAALAEGGGA